MLKHKVFALTCIGTFSLVMFMAAPAAAGSGDIVAIGDSILGLSKDEIQPLLEQQGWTVHAEHVNGSGLTVGANLNVTYDWQTRMTELEQQYDPDTVIIVLGTNDARSVSGGEPYPPHITRLLSATDARRVLWMDCSTNTYVSAVNDGCEIINSNLYATEREGFEVLPYNEEVVSDPTFGTTDTVHPDLHSQGLIANMIARFIGSHSK